MKQLLAIAALAVFSASCNNAPKADDTAALQVRQQMTIDSLKNEAAKKQIIDSMSQVAVKQTPPPVEKRVVTTYRSSGSTAATPAPAATVAAQPEAKKKKGWSAKAKGAVIGAGVGAVSGAMIDGRKGEGAIVGGILGAGAGTGVGAIIDKKQKDKEK